MIRLCENRENSDARIAIKNTGDYLSFVISTGFRALSARLSTLLAMVMIVIATFICTLFADVFAQCHRFGGIFSPHGKEVGGSQTGFSAGFVRADAIYHVLQIVFIEAIVGAPEAVACAFV